MKMKFIFLVIAHFIFLIGFSQYIGVKARYTETRLVDNPPHAPSRENRLVLSFFEVSPSGVYTPASLTAYDTYIYKEGFQYGSFTGGVLDSNGNNYPGYAMTAPQVVAYYNSWNPNAIDCDANVVTQYTVNGHELDCGFIRVSHWEADVNTGFENEVFTAPNICLPYYSWPHSYANSPGNVNFTQPIPATPPDNIHSFYCTDGIQQVVIRGVLPSDSSGPTALPVRFANEKVTADDKCNIKLYWSNLTESDVHYYSVERSVSGSAFEQRGIVFPYGNNYDRADYEFPDKTGNIQGTIIYRIRAVENSGKYFYSAALKVNGCSQRLIFIVYPNPVLNGQFTFRITDLPYGRYETVLINSTGQEVKLKVFDHTGGPFSQFISTYPIPPGIYLFIIRSKEISMIQRLIISN